MSLPAEYAGMSAEELRCQYPSKHCDNIRTTKRGGGLHQLCAFHRDKANKTQYMVDQRRRQRRIKAAQDKAQAQAAAMALDDEPDIMAPRVSEHGPGDFGSPLTSAELQILEALLFDDDQEDLDMLCSLVPDM